VTQQSRFNITVDGGEFWRPLTQPVSEVWEKKGFRYTWTVDPSGPLTVKRLMTIRGLYLEANEMPDFLADAKIAEDREIQPIMLERLSQ
jgi:hypothetical protein